MKNPPWNRDELILALDLYFKVNPAKASSSHREIVKLSHLLNQLPRLEGTIDSPLYRNPNGVYMKLCNFLRFDPTYRGKGLTRGGKLEETIWEEFSQDRVNLLHTAESIKQTFGQIKTQDSDFREIVDDEEFMEGRILTTLHKRRERNPKLAQKKKNNVMRREGRLACEVCGFDFKEVYGDLGKGFAECHHRVALFRLAEMHATRLEDLAIVCANCHRILHRSRPMLAVESLMETIREKGVYK